MFYEVLQTILKVVISVSIVGAFFYLDYSVLFKKRIVVFRSVLATSALLLLFLVIMIADILKLGKIMLLFEVTPYNIISNLLLVLMFFLLFNTARKTYYFYGSKNSLKEATMNSLDEMKMKYKEYDYSNEIFLPEINNFIKITRFFDNSSEISLEKVKDIPFFKDLVKRIKKYCDKKEVKPTGGLYLYYFPIFIILGVVYWLRVLL